jgi:hypothetical protein
MASTTEEKVQQEQEEWEAEQAEAQAADPTGEEDLPEADDDGKLFDATDYEREDLQLPKVDGEGIDKIGIAFSGTVLLERSDPHDVALMRAMRLGGDVTLQIEATVSAKTTKYTTSREGELDAVVLLHGARVHTVYRPVTHEPAEDIPEAAA